MRYGYIRVSIDAEKAAKFGLVTRSELSTAAHNGDSAASSSPVTSRTTWERIALAASLIAPTYHQ